MLKISKIVFYDEPSVPEIDLDNLIRFVKKHTEIHTEKRKSILKLGTAQDAIKIASSRIFKLSVPYTKHTPTAEEIRFEEKNMQDTANNPNITYYDGIRLQNAFANMISGEELVQDVFHVIFTNKLCCTYDDTDKRYHGRALIGSNPAVISTTGIIEAPAKPREYYFDLITKSKLGVNIDSLKGKYAGTYLEYHDKRLSTVVEGYFLQALLYYVSGEAFCEDKDCRMFNAHWQKDLLHSQLEVKKLCKRHQKILETVKNLN